LSEITTPESKLFCKRWSKGNEVLFELKLERAEFQKWKYCPWCGEKLPCMKPPKINVIHKSHYTVIDDWVKICGAGRDSSSEHWGNVTCKKCLKKKTN